MSFSPEINTVVIVGAFFAIFLALLYSINLNRKLYKFRRVVDVEKEAEIMKSQGKKEAERIVTSAEEEAARIRARTDEESRHFEELSRKNNSILVDMSNEICKKKEERDALVREILFTKDDATLAECGLYRPSFSFDTSERYKSELECILQQTIRRSTEKTEGSCPEQESGDVSSRMECSGKSGSGRTNDQTESATHAPSF